MSAFICSPKHIAELARYATRWQGVYVKDAADILARENVKSVAYRYQDQYAKAVATGADVLDECAKDMACAESVEAFVRSVVAEELTLSLSVRSAPVRIIKLAQSLDYQSCEHPDYKASKASYLIRNIIADAIAELPGYDAAPWTLD